MNGLEMTDLIRRWDENNDRYTGIVLLTAEDTASSIMVAFDRGVDDFVSKSANHFELAARVYGAGRNAFQQNELRERTRALGSRFLQIRQHSLQDPETSLPNRAQLELHIEALIEHCKSRGGGLGVSLIEVGSSNDEVRLGTLKTIANSIQLSLRPMDMVARFDTSSFAVLVPYQDPDKFNPDLFERLISSIKRHTMQTTDQGKQLSISIGVWHGHEFDPPPSAQEIISRGIYIHQMEVGIKFLGKIMRLMEGSHTFFFKPACEYKSIHLEIFQIILDHQYGYLSMPYYFFGIGPHKYLLQSVTTM